MSRVVDSAVHEGTTPTDRPEDDFEVVVIGAGQAGLGMGYFLARRGRHFVILDRADSIAAAWRERWESLTLFTPRRYNSLPGLPFAGDPDGYPTRDEVIALRRDVRAADPAEQQRAETQLRQRALSAGGGREDGDR